MEGPGGVPVLAALKVFKATEYFLLWLYPKFYSKFFKDISG
jgi:hypothetical protein